MSGPLSETLTNTAYQGEAAIRLSVLIPFHRDNPCAQITTLAADAPAGVELIAFDDGRPDEALCEQVRACIMAVQTPAALIASRINLGRSGARNRLAMAARGDWLLFLDADMSVSPGFLTRWLEAIKHSSADALFGGYTPAQATAQTRLHAALARASDVHGAQRRNALGAAAVCSSNLAVRRHVMTECAFDEGYEGWGWEDVDWALSAQQRFTLGHIDNPAAHAGLETARALLDKFARSGPNFARLLKRHPAYASRPGARLALRIVKMRAAGPARMLGAAAARAPLPMALRVLGLKLYRAGVAAEALST